MGLFDGLFGNKYDDLDCDWYCDNCGAFMNSQWWRLYVWVFRRRTWGCSRLIYVKAIPKHFVVL